MLFAGADANYKFIFVDIGGKGRFGDAYIFENCKFGKNLKNGTLNLPAPMSLITGGELLPHVVIGDGAFALLANCICPYAEITV